MGFLNVIFITVLVIYLLGLFGRIFLRIWVNKKSREFTERFGGGAATGGQNRRQTKDKEGEVSVQETRRQEKKVSRNVGDYVDYEEIKEPKSQEESQEGAE